MNGNSTIRSTKEIMYNILQRVRAIKELQTKSDTIEAVTFRFEDKTIAVMFKEDNQIYTYNVDDIDKIEGA